MNIYIDESGNLGTQGRYFTIACLISHRPKRLKNIVKRSKVKFGNEIPLRELKGRDMTFVQRQELVNKMVSSRDFEFAYIVADKHHLKPDLLRQKNLCYNYLVGHLLKSVVRSANEPINIVCDNRDIKITSRKTLEGYLQLKACTEWSFGYDLFLCYEDSRQYNLLQAVDVICNTVHGRYELKKGHCYRIIRPHLRYGIRFPHASFGR